MDDSSTANDQQCRLSCSQPAADRLQITLAGEWRHDRQQPTNEAVIGCLEGSAAVRQLQFDCRELSGWDSSLLTFLLGVINKCEQTGIVVVRDGLPEGVQKLLHLATAVPEKTTAINNMAKLPDRLIMQGMQSGLAWGLIITEPQDKMTLTASEPHTGFAALGACTPYPAK
ncbi:MAG: hypothetical protein BA869_09640 [Desulfuromonadales bacterium C00003107]|jgi:phospholipid/cholesterol/gamma-HCH transport system permease protein|nr:MAG: hypothetical protein BA869_09640 [Desulfuromonadales bacterium C00003107]